ncbi:MAG: glycosyltransferase family 2 protein [Candidatus Micrarchaeaceae archaeon]
MDILLISFTAFSFIIFLIMLAIDLRKPFSRRTYGSELHPYGYHPKVLVIVPCRGKDLTLGRNLRSIKNQEYGGSFRVVAVVDEAEDKAVPIIRKAGIEFAVSGQLNGMSSGKVTAILAAIRKFNGYKMYVIADSDIEVDKHWLSNLVSPMQDRTIGISTMFPYFNPVGGFWSKVKMAWGFVGESLLESESSRFGWGGSLAFRKGIIDRWFINLATRTKYGVSDDICITIAAKRKGLRIAYTRKSQPKVNSNDSFGQFLEWANRQTALTILGYKKNLYIGVFYYSAEIILLVSGISLSIFASPIFIVYFFHLLQSYLKAFRRARKPYPELILIVPIMPFLYLANLLVASRMDHIVWRGRKYPL